MAKYLFFIIALFSSHLYAENNFMSSFISGNYSLIGQEVNKGKPYAGSVSIYLEEDEIKVKRDINGKTVIGYAKFEPVLNGESTALRIRFSNEGVQYEETCMFPGDLDNNARITCYLYTPGKNILNPGLEALFIVN